MSRHLHRRLLTAAAAVLVGAGLTVGTALPSTAGAPRPRQGGTTSAITWGHNSTGALGLGSTAGALTPVPVELPRRTTSVALGQGYSLALTSGTVWAWGDNDFGQLGDGTTRTRLRPVRVRLPRSATVVAVAADLDHSLALTSTGRVYAWGANQYGQLGDRTTQTRKRPVRVVTRSRVVAIAAGQDHSLAVTRRGAVLAWGRNHQGQLGDGTTAQRTRPVRASLPPRTRVAVVSAGTGQSVALTRSGRVITWGTARLVGSSEAAQQPRSAPPRAVDLPHRSRVVAVAAGSRHTLALTRRGQVYAWGDNETGQLGTGTASTELSPVRVATPSRSKVTSIDATGETSLLLTSSRDVWAWGVNDFGQLGNGELSPRNRPERIAAPAGTQIKTIAAGHSHNLALTAATPRAGRPSEAGNATTSPNTSPHNASKPASASAEHPPAVPAPGLTESDGRPSITGAIARSFRWLTDLTR